MQKDSNRPTSIQMIVHCSMGVILGALLALALIVSNQNIFQLIVTSPSPLLDLAVVIGFFSFMVGIGSTLTGFFFTLVENSSEAKHQIEPFKKRNNSDGWQ
jgi:cytochrome b561